MGGGGWDSESKMQHLWKNYWHCSKRNQFNAEAHATTSKELDELNKIEEKEKSAPKQMKQPKLFSIGAIVKVKIAVNPETQARY